MEVTAVLTIPDQHADTPSKDTKWGKPCRTGWEEVASGASKTKPMNRMDGREALLRRIQNISNNILV